MKKITGVLLTALILVLALGTLNVSAALDTSWKRTMGFGSSEVGGASYNNGTWSNLTAGGIAYVRDVAISPTVGSYIVLNNTAYGNFVFAEDVNHTQGETSGRSIKFTAIDSNNPLKFNFAYTNFSGTPVFAGFSGSVVEDAATITTGYPYNNCRIFEFSYYLNFNAFGYFLDNPDLWLKDGTEYLYPLAMRVSVDNNGYLSCGGVSAGKRLNTNEWYQIKRLVNFDNDTVYTYFNDELIGTYKPTKEIVKMRRTEITLNVGTMVYVDDICSDPKNGEGVTKNVGNSETTFYINGSEATTISAGTATADVKLFNDFSEKSVTVVSVVYDINGTIKRVLLQDEDLTNFMEKNVKLSSDTVTATDKVKIMFFDNINNIMPLKQADTLKPAE